MRQPRYKDIFKGSEDGEAMAALAAVKWAEVKAHLEDNDLATKTRMSMADRYVRACVEYEFLYPEVIADGPVKVSRSTGGEYFNYKWSAVEKLNDRISKMETALLISPQSADGKLSAPKKVGKTAAETKWLKSA